MNRTLSVLCADLTGIRRCLLDRERAEITWEDRVALATLLSEFEGYLMLTMTNLPPTRKVLDSPTSDA